MLIFVNHNFCSILIHPYLWLFMVAASLLRIEYPILFSRNYNWTQTSGTHQRTTAHACENRRIQSWS